MPIMREARSPLAGRAQKIGGYQNILAAIETRSPGPFVNNPSDADNPTRGRSVGQLQQDGFNVTQLCRTAFGN